MRVIPWQGAAKVRAALDLIPDVTKPQLTRPRNAKHGMKTYSFTALVVLLLLAVPLAAFAQNPLPALTAFDLLRYDAQADGALVLVGDALNFAPGENAQVGMRKMFADKTSAGVGKILDRRLLRVGNVTALVPREMPVIAAHPGKPDPFAGMGANERLTLFQSTLSPEQWKLFGAASGIGANDLTDDQRPLFAGLIPASFTRHSLRPSPAGTGYVPDKESKPQTVPGETVRLRAVRRLTFRFWETVDGKKETTCASNVAEAFPGQKNKTFSDGAEGIEMLDSDERTKEIGEKPEGLLAFGKTLIASAPSRLKPGQLPMDTPALDGRVALHAGVETVGALLKRVAEVSNLRIVADKRYAAQSVTCRLPKAGSTVTARDALTVLCRSLSGTFRRLDAPDGTIYLLTFDVEGVGTQFARLGDWGEVADAARRDAQIKATEQAAKNDPLAAIGYAQTDLPATLLKSLDTFYETGERLYRGLPLKASELPPALRDRLREQTDYWQKNGHAVRADKVNIATELGYDFVLPDKTAWVSQLDTNINLESFVRREKGNTSTPKPPPAPLPMPLSLKKRVVVLPLPASGADDERLFALAKRKGFTETWLRASLYAPETPERMANFVALGKKSEMSVGAVVSWLKREPGDTFGTEDITLLGETGTQYADRMCRTSAARYPEKPEYANINAMITAQFAHYAGWTVSDAAPALAPLAALAQTQDLSALVLTDTAAPGWYEVNKDSRMGAFALGKVGYTLPTRLACLRSEGFDPVDVAEHPVNLSLEPDIILPQEDARRSLAAFRARVNVAELTRLFPVVRSANPTLPLFLDDRIPLGITENGAFVRWDDAKKLLPPVDGNGDGMASRKTFGTESLYSYQPGSHQSPLRNTIEFGEYASTAAKGWQGLVYDVSRSFAATAERNLEALPDAATAPSARRPAQGLPR